MDKSDQDKPEPGEPAGSEPSGMGDLEQKFGELEQKLVDTDDKYRRALADLANLHKRFQKERDRIAAATVASFVLKLLPMIDNFSHALRTAQETHDPATLIEGFGLVETQLLKILKENGIEPIESTGKRFDPEFHHAAMADYTDKVPPGTVTEEVGRGFRMGDFVIRPAQVKVAAAPVPKQEKDS